MVAWPLTRLDICVMSDGAAATILCSEEGLKKLEAAGAKIARPLVKVTGIGRGTDMMRMADRPHVDYDTFMRDYATEQERSSDETRTYYKKLWDHGTRYPGVHSFRAGRTAGNMAYKHAGISDPLNELDFVELHDAYTSSEIQTYEDLGLCRYGEGGPFAESGKAFLPDIDYGLKLKDKPVCAVNPSGGLIACGHPVGATGLMQACSPSGSCRGRSRNISAMTSCRSRMRSGARSIQPCRHGHVRHRLRLGKGGLSHGQTTFNQREETLGGYIVHGMPFPVSTDEESLAFLKKMAPIQIEQEYKITYLHSYGQDSPWFAGLTNKRPARLARPQERIHLRQPARPRHVFRRGDQVDRHHERPGARACLHRLLLRLGGVPARDARSCWR